MFQDGFPNYLRDDVTNNVIRFPYRIYYIDKSDEVIDNLSVRQKMILH
jgi:hypothetical protein